MAKNSISFEEFDSNVWWDAKSIEKEPMIIPGDYDGLWSAYYVEIIFHKGNKSHKIKLDEGIRGINCKCKVTVDKDGWVYVC